MQTLTMVCSTSTIMTGAATLGAVAFVLILGALTQRPSLYKGMAFRDAKKSGATLADRHKFELWNVRVAAIINTEMMVGVACAALALRGFAVAAFL